ncbi:hypothetical protein EC957_001603 [Mortierella hygrophila]|uniref:Uncharacterized protein n=1 Tax=Mortierella hygrophila TaxID=979708 RepID=A0A9P6FFJ7_9FUNG|nr:hypothetical protein EC957_001603 [Mortierella hygrophila]
MEVQPAALPIMPVSTSSTSTTAAMPLSPQKSAPTTTSKATTASLPTTTSPSTTNDPYPTWTFFPDSATYTPPVYPTTSVGAAPSSPPTIPLSPPRSPRSPPPPQTSNASGNGRKGQASSSTTSASTPSSTTASSSTPSTHHRILDHCFHVSIETRLQQAEAQYQASRQELAVEQQATNGVKQDDWRKRQRSLVDEAVVLGRKGSNLEAIVDGILKSHRSNGPLQTLPRHIKIRLHLCQLTSMVFGRFDVASSTNSAGLNVYSAFHSRRHGVSRAAIKQRFANSERGQQMQPLFSQPILASSYCRRHHRRDCKRTCCTLAKLQQEQQLALELKKKLANSYFMNTVRKQEHQRVAGLVDAIPAFLKCSAMSYRDIVNNTEAEHKKDKEAKNNKETDSKGKDENQEQQENRDAEKEKVKVLEGWYKLLLEMMTQAVLESYLCDENTGFDTILDVFSFGDDPNKEEEEVALKDIVMEDVTVASSPSSSVGVEGLQFQNLGGLGSATSMPKSHGSQLHDVTTKDRQDDILFAKTPEYFAFKQAKDERLNEFLTLEGDTMEHHFAELAEKYPLIVFERQMTHFIARAQKLLVDPKLSQNSDQMGLLIPPTTSAYADGSLSMPVSEDEDEDDDEDTGSRLEEITEEDEEDTSSSSVPVIKKEKLDTNETIDEQKRRLERSSTPLVAIKQEGGSNENNSNGSMAMEQDDDDDDNSTAARVVQVSKKHKHQIETSDHSQDAQTDAIAAHLAKKAKVSP